MNDRFKFRVWDDVNNKYVNKGVLLRCGDLAIPSMKNDYDMNPVDGRYSIEQCTGLKDKNGKLVYEGDILKPNGNTITKEVVYEDGSYWAKDTIYFHDKCHIFQKWIDECGYEIVGNIHEKESK